MKPLLTALFITLLITAGAVYNKSSYDGYRRNMKAAIRHHIEMSSTRTPTVEEMQLFILIEIYQQKGGDLWNE